MLDVLDADGLLLLGNHRIVVGDKEPTQEDVLQFLASKEGELTEMFAPSTLPPVQEIYTRDEVEGILKGKGYLTQIQTISDLKPLDTVKAEIVAESR